MNSRNEITKFTVELPTKIHKKLKTLAAASGKTMKDLIIDAIPFIIISNKKNLTEEESAETAWLFKPENAHLFKEAKEGLSETEYVDIDLDELEKYVSK